MAASSTWDDNKPKYIVLGPGGIRGFYILGALHHLYNEGLLNHVVGYSGSSVGAMIGLLITCGYSPVEIITMAADTNIFTDFYNISMGDKLSEMKKNFGIASNAAIRAKLENAVIDKYNRVVNLHELYFMTGIEFVAVTHNVDTKKAMYISYKSHPTMDVVTAVLLSINIPLLFYKMTYGLNICIDGGFCDPMPIYPFDDGVQPVLAIIINTEISPPKDNEPFMKKIVAYLHQILITPINRLKEVIIASASPMCDILVLESHIADTTGVTLSSEAKAEMITNGVNGAIKYHKVIQDRPPRTPNPDGVYFRDICDRMEQNEKRLIKFG